MQLNTSVGQGVHDFAFFEAEGAGPETLGRSIVGTIMPMDRSNTALFVSAPSFRAVSTKLRDCASLSGLGFGFLDIRFSLSPRFFVNKLFHRSAACLLRQAAAYSRAQSPSHQSPCGYYTENQIQRGSGLNDCDHNADKRPSCHA